MIDHTFKLSIHDRCLRDDQFTRLQREPAVELEVSSDFGKSIRGFSLIPTNVGVVYADRVTGTLYTRKSGTCLTSSKLKLNTRSK